MCEIDKMRAKRAERVKTCIELGTPDRVPFVPKVAAQYAIPYGIPMYAVLKDLRNMIPGIKEFFTEVEVDLAWAPIQYPIDPMVELGACHINFPGADSNIPLNQGFQIHDGTYIYDDEFDELCFDPTNFLLTKLLPRKFKALKGLENLNFQNPTEYNFLMDISAAALPDTLEAINSLIQGAKLSAKWAGQLGECAKTIHDLGFPLGPNIAQTCPFDMFTDNYRGIVSVMYDLSERPEQLLEVLKVMERICVERVIKTAKAVNAQYVFIPLHNGVDEFMSPKMYEKFYWPGLKAMMVEIIENGMTPYVFCEGKYNNRLDIISDIPKGKVAYMFEEVDIKKAKRALEGVACVCGNLPAATLAFGKKEEVIDMTKRMIDDCAGGGGFMMDCSIVLDNASRENMIAWYETTINYGKY